MTKFTVKSLISLLENFPEDLEINNELALTWEYDDNIDEKAIGATMRHATSLYILEGDWSKETVESFERIWKDSD